MLPLPISYLISKKSLLQLTFNNLADQFKTLLEKVFLHLKMSGLTCLVIYSQVLLQIKVLLNGESFFNARSSKTGQTF